MSVKRNTFYNLLGGVIPTAAAIVAIPYLLHGLGNARFGVLTIIWAIIGYLNLFDLGVSRSLTYEISKIRHTRPEEVSGTIVAGMLIATCTAIAGALLLYSGSNWFVTNWLTLDPALFDDAHRAMVLISLAIVPVAITSGVRGVLEGLNRFAAANAIRAIVGTLMFVLPMLAVALGHANLATASLYLLAGRVVLALGSVSLIWTELTGAAYRHANSSVAPMRRLLDRVKRLLGYGLWIAVTGVIGPLLTSGDRFVIAKMINVALMPAYIIPQEGLQKLLLLPGALFGALFPRISELDSRDVGALFWRYYKLMAVAMAAVCAIAAIGSYPVLKFWVSEEFARSATPIAIILCLGIWINSLTIAPYTLLHARGKPRTTALIQLVELVLYVAALVVMLDWFGLIGAAYTWVLRAAFDLVLLHIAAVRALNEV